MLAAVLGPALVFADLWDGSNAASKFLMLCMGAAVAFLGAGLVLTGGGPLPKWRPGDAAVAAYVAWLAVATAASADFMLALSGYRPYWDGMVAALAAAAAYAACRVAFPEAGAASKALRSVLRFAAAAFLVMAFASLLGLLGVPLMRSVAFDGGRLGALIHQPTFLAGLIAVWVVPIGAWALAEFRAERRGVRAWVGLSATIAMLVMLAATAGRAGLAGAAVAAVAFALLSAETRGRALRRAAIAVALAMAVAVPVLIVRGGTDPARVARSFDMSSFVARTGAWGTAVRAASARPVLGSGPGTFVYAHQRQMTLEEARKLKTRLLLDPHDWILASAVAAGWPAAAAALAITACGAFAAWRARRGSGAALAAACGVIGHGVAVLATPNAFVIFPSALLMLAFAETLAPGSGARASAPRAAGIAAGALAAALALGVGGWGVRAFAAEWAYGTSRATFDAAGLGRAVRTAPEVAEYARYAAGAKVVAAKLAGPSSVEFSQAEDALVALAAAHPRDPLALLSAGALVDLSAVARSQAATDHAGRLATRAVPVLSMAVEAAPFSGDARLRYAEALLYVGETEAAEAQFQEARRNGTARSAQLLHVRDLLKEAGAI